MSLVCAQCVLVLCLLVFYCVLGVQEVLIDYQISMSVNMNHINTTLRVYTDLEGALPSRMGSEVISYGLSVVRICYICLGLAVSLC